MLSGLEMQRQQELPPMERTHFFSKDLGNVRTPYLRHCFEGGSTGSVGRFIHDTVASYFPDENLSRIYLGSRGMSGIISISAASAISGMPIIAVRKNEGFTHGEYEVEGMPENWSNRKWIFVDDMISSGETLWGTIKAIGKMPIGMILYNHKRFYRGWSENTEPEKSTWFKEDTVANYLGRLSYRPEVKNFIEKHLPLPQVAPTIPGFTSLSKES